MPTVTAPYIETSQVVTGFMCQLHIAEGAGGQGITKLEIGPFRFPGTPPLVKYPEAVTNEMCPPGWAAIHWITDASGQSWLRWQGGRLSHEDGEVIFQMTSNYPPTHEHVGPALCVYRGSSDKGERYEIPTPDYSTPPPQINPRHDVIGKGGTFVRGTVDEDGKKVAKMSGAGCVPMIALTLAPLIMAVVKHYIG